MASDKTITKGAEAVKNDPPASILHDDDCHRLNIDILYSAGDQSMRDRLFQIPGGGITLSYPVDSLRTLYHRAHLEAQFNHYHQSNNQTLSFDAAVCEVSDWALRQEGVEIPDSTDDQQYLYATLLHDACSLNSWPLFTERLTQNQLIRETLGFESVPDQSTFNRNSKQFSNRERIRRAAIRARHAAFRSGADLPPTLTTDLATPSAVGDNIPVATQQQALLNWANELLPSILDTGLFNRTGSVRYDVREIVGTLAYAALQSGVPSGTRMANLLGHPDSVATPRHINAILSKLNDGVDNKQLDRSIASELARTLHQNFFSYITQFDFHERPSSLAADITWELHGREDDEYPRHSFLEQNAQKNQGYNWIYATITTTDERSRFSTGVELVKNKGQVSGQYRDLLRRFGRYSPLGWLCADREHTGAAMITAFRATVGRQWIIRAQEEPGDIADFMNDLEPGVSDHGRISLNKLSGDTHIYAAPSEQLADDHYIFLTDMPPDEITPSKLREIYDGRWGVETFFSQHRHLCRPDTNSPDPQVRYLLANFGSIFYNIYSLINRTLSPNLGIPLSVKVDEVLLSIALSTIPLSEPGTPTVEEYV